MENLEKRRGVKITFVDLPVHRETILYNRYFLYAAQGVSDFKKVLRARRTLFHFAHTSPDAKKVREEALANLLQKEGIAFVPFDVKPVQSELGKIIRQYKVNSTPTCIIIYPGGESKEYGGVKGILDGLKSLKGTLKKSAP